MIRRNRKYLERRFDHKISGFMLVQALSSGKYRSTFDTCFDKLRDKYFAIIWGKIFHKKGASVKRWGSQLAKEDNIKH